MTEEELKNKCKERAKIFQQAMESCKSSSPMDCIEWFADRIAELEEKLKHAEENCINKTCVVFKDKEDCVAKLLELEKENAELKKSLHGIVYMATSGLHVKNQIAFDRCIAEAEKLLKEGANGNYKG